MTAIALVLASWPDGEDLRRIEVEMRRVAAKPESDELSAVLSSALAEDIAAELVRRSPTLSVLDGSW